MIEDQVQAFNEEMYYKYNYDKMNETMFIPLKSPNNTLNFTQQSSVISNRIFSGKNKNTTFMKPTIEFIEQSTQMGVTNPQKNDTLKPSLNTHYNDYLSNSIIINSPINEIGSFALGTGVKSFAHENDFKDQSAILRKKKRVMSAGYERMGYLKIKPKISCDDTSLAFNLINKPYEPKQLTTDKCCLFLFLFFLKKRRFQTTSLSCENFPRIKR